MGAASNTDFTASDVTRMLPLLRLIAGDLVADFMQMKVEGQEKLRLQQVQNPSDEQRARLQALRNSLTECSDRIDHYVRELNALGASIVDFKHGWLSFPTTIQGKPACIAWTLSDATVAYWCGPNEPFQRRRRITAA